MSEPQKGRIAIKFGTNSSSSSSAKAKRPQQLPPSTLGKRPRSTTNNQAVWGGADDSDSDDDRRGKHESITGFGAGGAESEVTRRRNEETKKEYVISKQRDDWKDKVQSRRRGKNLLPPEAQAQKNGTTTETEPADQDKEMKWGLTVKEKKNTSNDEDGEPESPSKPIQDVALRTKSSDNPPSRTADDEAMDALLGREPKKPQAVITPDEPDAFKNALRTAGEAPTLEDHEAMPVEEFGAALLRGMGWNGESDRKKPKAATRRPVKLGLGAKELKEAEDLGGWNQQSGTKKRPKLSEYRRAEELKKESRRNDRNDDGYKRERERERNGDRGTDRDRYRDKDRDRDRHGDRHRDQHRHRDSHRR